VFLRTKKTIAEVIEKTHDAVPIDAAGSKDLSILVGKLRGLECIVCFPDSMTEHPKLIRAFALDGIAGAETVVVSLRVCDANGLGRSAPKMCCGKFKFLFPGAPVDASQVVSRKKHKASAQPTQSAHTATPSRPSRAVKDKLNAMLRTQYDLHRDTKGFLCCVAKNFIESLGIELDEDTFNTKLDVYLPLDPEVVVVLFGSLETCRSIATSALGDATKVDHVMKTVAAHRDLLRDSMQHNTHSTPRTS
jgi:hypothetical protein